MDIETNLVEDNLFSNGKLYTCSQPDCCLQFKRRDQLKSHEYTHTQVKTFKCPVSNCDKVYITNAHLQRHIRNTHPDNDSDILKCQIENCNLRFTTKQILQKHLRTHREPTEYECDICSAKYHRKYQFRQHMVSHTGEYPYKCDHCDKGFIRLSCLKNHKLYHRSHKCELCEFVTDKWSLLVAHRRTLHSNTEIKCDKCNRMFQSKRGLKYHQQIHEDSDERIVFQCNFVKCPKFFFHRQNLLAHIKSKHEHRTFPCTYDGCNSKLSSKQKLDQHIKSIHLNQSKLAGKRKKSVEERKPRKDKGIPKTSTISKLLNIIAPVEIEKAIIAGEGSKIDIVYDEKDIE